MNKQLKQIYLEDIADRTDDLEDKLLQIRDQKRRRIVQEILNTTHDLSALDFHHAALIFQHGETAAHFKKAHQLARQAFELGDDTAKWLVAASLDRWLIKKGKPQNYGTQFLLKNGGQWELSQPVNPEITDQERAIWNVPPLKDALKIFKQKSGI